MSHQCAVKRNKGDLLINGHPYQKAVNPPTLKSVLLSPSKTTLKDEKVYKGASRNQDGSAFYSYVTEAKSFGEVQSAYKAIKSCHISSTHILCGYRIFGANFLNRQDFSNDGEHGGGRVILNTLKDANVWNVAVFCCPLS